MGWVGKRPGKLALGVGGSVLLLSGIGSVAIWQQGTQYLRETVVPQLSQDLSTSLNRPVHLGGVEHLSLTQIRLGPSSIPATESDADAVEVESVEVRFDWLTALRNQTLQLDVTLVNPQILLDQNADGDWIETKLALDEDERITVEHLRIRDGAIALVPYATGFNGEGVLHPKATVSLPSQFEFDDIHAHVALGKDMEGFKFRASADSRLGGDITLRGQAALEPESPDSAFTLDVTLDTNHFSTLPLNLLLPPSVRLTDGQMNSQLQLQMRPDAQPVVQGTVGVYDLAAWVKGEPNPFTETEGQFQIRNQDIQLTRGFTRYGKIPFDVEGGIHLTNGLDLDAQVSSVPVVDFMDTFNLGLPFPVTGALMSENLRITGPLDYAVFSGTVANAVPIDMDRLTLDAVQTEFEFDTQRDRLLLRDTTLMPQIGGQVTLNGDIHLDSGDNDEVALTVEAEDLPGEAIAQLYDLPLPSGALGSLHAAATVAIAAQHPTITLQWQNESSVYPAAGTVHVEGDRLTVKDMIVQVAQHPISIDGSVADGQWTLNLDTAALSVGEWMPEGNFEGDLTGRVALMGTLDDLNPEAISAIAQLKLANVQLAGVPQFSTQPIDLDLQWQDSHLTIAAVADALSMNGWVGVELDGPGAIEITESDLALHVQDYDLASLPIVLPDGVTVKGRSTVQGRLTGTPEDPKIQGNVLFNDLGINAFAFAPKLRGSFQWTTEAGADLQLIGQEEAIALSLHPTGQLNAFDIQLTQGSIQGKTIPSGEILTTVEKLPLSILTALSSPFLPSSFVDGVSGDLSVHLVANLADMSQPEVMADFVVERPWFNPVADTFARPLESSRHGGDRIAGSVHYANNQVSLTDGNVQFGYSAAEVTAQAALTSDASLTADVSVHQGDLKDVATLLQALVVPTLSPIEPSVLALNDSPGLRSDVPFDVSLLSGTFTGHVQMAMSAETPMDIQATLNGQHWFVGPIGIEHVSINNAKFQGSELDFSQLGDAQVSGLLIDTPAGDRHLLDTHVQLSRSAGGTWRGHAEAKDISLTTLAKLLELPIDITGDMDAIASLSGNTHISQIAGTVGIDNACINALALNDFDVEVGHHQGIFTVAGWPIPSATMNELALSFGLPTHQAFLPIKSEPDVRQTPIALPHEYPMVLLPNSSALERIVIAYGPLALSLPLSDLEALAATGSIPPVWQRYLNLAGVTVTDVRQSLTHLAQLDVALVDRVLNSPFGQELLTSAGQVLRTPSRQPSIQALRAALVMAAQDDNQLSLLEVFQHYPLQELHVDAAQLIRLMERAECDRQS